MQSFYSMRRYESVGELLKEIRTKLEKTQLAMAELIDVNIRTYRRWENGENISDVHMGKVVEKLSVPFEVILRLNHDYPTLYNINTRRYSLCPFDRDYVNRKILKSELWDTNEVGKITHLINYPKFKKYKTIDFPIYPYKRTLKDDFLYKAASRLPELNVRITDHKGYYSGHMVTIPVGMDDYNRMKARQIEECDLDRYEVADIDPQAPIALHILSLFATNTTYLYGLTKQLVYFLISSVPRKLNENSIISRYAITEDGVEFCRKFEMDLVYHMVEDQYKYNTDVVPHFFEVAISKIQWLSFYKQKVIGRG